MPPSAYSGDIHCVTTGPKFDMTFTGVSVDDLLDLAKPLDDAAFVLAHSSTGYTTNLPVSDVTGGRAAGSCSSQGRPLRSSTEARPGCWCRTSTSGSRRSGSRGWRSARRKAGFWERNGYHDGDPWQEQRYQGD